MAKKEKVFRETDSTWMNLERDPVGATPTPTPTHESVEKLDIEMLENLVKGKK